MVFIKVLFDLFDNLTLFQRLLVKAQSQRCQYFDEQCNALLFIGDGIKVCRKRGEVNRRIVIPREHQISPNAFVVIIFVNIFELGSVKAGKVKFLRRRSAACLRRQIKNQ